ncbi:MAG: methyltransferase [Burkholderiaceae bacterium]|nr:methyltransferase [Burkholderiaceae bacterium]
MSAAADARCATRLLDLIGGNWTTQAIGAAVALGVVDELARARCTAEQLAQRTGCAPRALQRLLNGLTAIDIVTRDAAGRHALSATGALLREDAAGSMRWWAQWCSGPQWSLWGNLAQSVRTGRSARTLAGGRPGYAHLEADVGTARLFHRAMAGLTRRIGRRIARDLDWRGVRQVVDIGGGYGELLAEVLAAQRSVRGIVFDLPHATRDAAAYLAERGLAARCAVVCGSFFEPLPAGADVYLLKSILHNWDDADALRILRQCRAATPAAARVLVVERVLPAQAAGGRRERAVLRSDLNMLVSLGGRERTRTRVCRTRLAGGLRVPAARWHRARLRRPRDAAGARSSGAVSGGQGAGAAGPTRSRYACQVA